MNYWKFATVRSESYFVLFSSFEILKVSINEFLGIVNLSFQEKLSPTTVSTYFISTCGSVGEWLLINNFLRNILIGRQGTKWGPTKRPGKIYASKFVFIRPKKTNKHTAGFYLSKNLEEINTKYIIPRF